MLGPYKHISEVPPERLAAFNKFFRENYETVLRTILLLAEIIPPDKMLELLTKAKQETAEFFKGVTIDHQTVQVPEEGNPKDPPLPGSGTPGG